MICDKCKKNPATVHMQQFILGAKAELHLCQECTLSFDTPDIPLALESVFKGILEQMQAKLISPNLQAQMPTTAPLMACASCGMTGDELKTSGKLGCRQCYYSFVGEMGAILKNVQGSTRHEGKFPKRLGKEILFKRQTSDLRRQLSEAIQQENFELAAKLRDEIRTLEAQ